MGSSSVTLAMLIPGHSVAAASIMNPLLLSIIGVLSLPSIQSSEIFVSPYNFSLNPDTHQLHTTWEVKGSSISLLCAFAEVSLMELSWTGESKALSSGNSWAVNCEKGELGNKMVIEVDVTKFRVQPFRSYKVCISLEDSLRDYYLDEVCTHLFSFEKYVPYVPDDEEMDTSVIDDIISENDLRHTQVNHKEDETKVKTELEDIENFVRDDYKVSFLSIGDRTELELSLKILEDLDQFVIEHSSLEKIVVPDVDDDSVIDDIISENDMRHVTHVKNKESETKEQNKDVKTQLEDIEDFVRDDYKIGFLSIEDRTELQLSLKILEDLDEFVIEHSSSEKIYFSFVMVLLTGVLIIVR